MAGRYLFQQCKDGTHRTRPCNIVRAVRFLRGHPAREIQTGIWTNDRWDWQSFRNWWRTAIADKTNPLRGRSWRKLDPVYQAEMRRDARIIRENARGLVRSGVNLLSTPEMQRRFPG